MTALSISPAGAASAYARTQQGGPGLAAGPSDFGAVLTKALDNTIAAGHSADSATAQALSGHANLTEVVTAVSRAELALQTATALRDRMVSAYQDVMRMAI